MHQESPEVSISQSNIEARMPSDAEHYKPTVFQSTRFKGAGDFYAISIARLADAITRLVNNDSPVHKDVVKKRLSAALNVKLGIRVNQRIDEAIRASIRSGSIREQGNFLWLSTMKTPALRIYIQGSAKREIDEISPEEISLAIVECVRNSLSISPVDLAKEVSRLFGLKATAHVSSQIELVIDKLVKYHVIVNKKGKLALK